jgi:hypothetical protein
LLLARHREASTRSELHSHSVHAATNYFYLGTIDRIRAVLSPFFYRIRNQRTSTHATVSRKIITF